MGELVLVQCHAFYFILFFILQWMQAEILLSHAGSFDLKTSRVQECGSMDMSKFGHSQTGKIKSKHNVCSPTFCYLL